LKQALDDRGYPWVEVPFKGETGLRICSHLEIKPDGSGFYRIDSDFYFAAGELDMLHGMTEQAFSNEIQRKYAELKVKKELAARGYSIVSEQAGQSGELRITARRVG